QMIGFPGPGSVEHPEAVFGVQNLASGQEDHYRYDIYGMSHRNFVSWSSSRENGGLNLMAKFSDLDGSVSEETAQIYDNNNHHLGAVKYTFNPDGQVTSCGSSTPENPTAIKTIWSGSVK